MSFSSLLKDNECRDVGQPTGWPNDEYAVHRGRPSGGAAHALGLRDLQFSSLGHRVRSVWPVQHRLSSLPCVTYCIAYCIAYCICESYVIYSKSEKMQLALPLASRQGCNTHLPHQHDRSPEETVPFQWM